MFRKQAGQKGLTYIPLQALFSPLLLSILGQFLTPDLLLTA